MVQWLMMHLMRKVNWFLLDHLSKWTITLFMNSVVLTVHIKIPYFMVKVRIVHTLKALSKAALTNKKVVSLCLIVFSNMSKKKRWSVLNQKLNYNKKNKRNAASNQKLLAIQALKIRETLINLFKTRIHFWWKSRLRKRIYESKKSKNYKWKTKRRLNSIRNLNRYSY